MGFNYAREKKRFDQTWARLCREYLEAGMSPEDIQSLYEFDLDAFRSQRRYAAHTQVLPQEPVNSRGKNALALPGGACSFSENDFPGRYAWVDGIENPKLARRLKQLSDEDLELLTLLVLEERSQRELARMLGCSQAAISQRYTRIKIFLKKPY